jgi:CBS domain-containing protein
MTVTDLMREDVVTAAGDATAADLARQMRDEGVGSVVVVDDEARPAGVVTDRDLAVEVVADGGDPTALTADQVMTGPPETVGTDTGVMELCDRLNEASVRRMPVVDDDGTLAGIVTLDDLTVLLTDELGALAGVVEAESPPY